MERVAKPGPFITCPGLGRLANITSKQRVMAPC